MIKWDASHSINNYNNVDMETYFSFLRLNILREEPRLRYQTVTEEMGAGVGEQYTIIKRTSPFALGVPPPTRFTMPAARGKTSLNARDW